MCRVNKKKKKVNLNIKSVIPKPILNKHCKINIIDQKINQIPKIPKKI